MVDGAVVGNRWVPSLIEVDFPGADDQPSLYMVIELVLGVPRCTELTIKRTESGRDIRERDLRAVDLDGWVEAFVAACSGEVQERTAEHTKVAFSGDARSVWQGMQIIRDVRKGSRRTPTEAELKRVADVYLADDRGGLNRLLAAGYTPSTAKRRIREARNAGFIPQKES